MAEHSKDFEQIKMWYLEGLWSKTRVRNAVMKGKITAEEYKEITGEDYAERS